MSSSMFFARANQFKIWDRGNFNFPNICLTPNHEYMDGVKTWHSWTIGVTDCQTESLKNIPKNEKMKLVNCQPGCAGVRQRCQVWVAPTFPTWRNVFQELQRQRQLGNKRFHTQCKLGTGGAVLHTGPGCHQIIAPTKESIAATKRGDKVTLTLGGCDSLWALFQESPTTAGRDRPLRWSEVEWGGERGGRGGAGWQHGFCGLRLVTPI